MIDPDIAAFQQRTIALNLPPANQVTPDQARANTYIRRTIYSPGEAVHHVEDRTIDGLGGPIPVRIYRPDAKDLLPVIVFFHGGGWVVGDLENEDSLCRALANATPAVVVSVNYRHAPEHRFPAAFDDAISAVAWASDNAESLGADAGRIVIGGSSAGGNLAAAAAIAARDRGISGVVAQILLYPALDRAFDTESYREKGEGFTLSTVVMQFYWDQYLATSEDAKNPYAAPMQVADVSGLAPAIFVHAEHDPLRSEGQAYAERLRGGGIPVTELLYPGTLHAFVAWVADIPIARTALADIVATLRTYLAHDGS